MAVIKIILSRKKVAVWAGIIWPIAFILVFILAGFFHINYNPFEMYISELSIGAYGWIQIVNFIILGISFLLFTYGISYEFHEGKLAKTGLILLAIIGFSLILSGPFITDPANTPRNLWTVHGTIHQIFGAIVFLLMPVSCFIFWRCFRNNLRWKSFQLWTFIAGIIIAATVILLRIASIQTPFSGILADWLGLIQRIILIIYLIWVFTFALGLLKLTNGNSVETTAMETTATATPTATAETTAAASAMQIIIANDVFQPNKTTIKIGGTVTWINNDGYAHIVASNSGVFNSGIITNGGQFSFTFNTEDVYDYICEIHPNMKGTITVIK